MLGRRIVTDETAFDPARTANSKMQLSAEEAGKRSEQESRRSLEIRAGFYDKLSALSAGSIALTVSVGIALLGKSAVPFGSVHSQLSWLLWISGCLMTSLLCSIFHNFIFVNIARLESERAKAWSNYLALMNAEISSSSGGGKEILGKLLADTLHQRITDGAINLHRTEQGMYRVKLLGMIAVLTFLTAYALVMLAVGHLWWITR